MHCVSVAYPQKAGGTFDFEYYVRTHVPLVARLVGANAVKAEVRRGVASPDGSAPHFVCLANFWIKSPQEFQATLARHGSEIMGDIPNFTNLQPILQVDEVLT
jgi:uncharacterized protein (TIGR02118 family)